MNQVELEVRVGTPIGNYLPQQEYPARENYGEWKSKINPNKILLYIFRQTNKKQKLKYA